MTPAATLQCPCGEGMLVTAAEYTAPPDGETRFAFGARNYRRRYDSCAICGHWFARHDLDLSALYQRDYVDATYGGPEGMRRRFDAIMALPVERSDNRGRVARIRAYARDRGIDESVGPSVLDIGAGLGVFPAAMAQAGWRAVGLEPDSRTVTHLREVAGIEALPLSVEQLDPSQHGRFDAVTFNKVLEHVEDPTAVLAAAVRLLTPRGFIYVEVPDVAAACAGPGREEFFVEHHHVFSPASLVMLGQRAGLSVTTVERLREASGKFTLRLFAA
jgi:SAM-dependent methyltransferase